MRTVDGQYKRAQGFPRCALLEGAIPRERLKVVGEGLLPLSSAWVLDQRLEKHRRHLDAMACVIHIVERVGRDQVAAEALCKLLISRRDFWLASDWNLGSSVRPVST